MMPHPEKKKVCFSQFKFYHLRKIKQKRKVNFVNTVHRTGHTGLYIVTC